MNTTNQHWGTLTSVGMNPLSWTNNQWMHPTNTMNVPAQGVSAWQEATPSYYVPAQMATSWYPFQEGYGETGPIQTPTLMPALPLFPNKSEFDPRSPAASDHENSSDLSTKGARTPSMSMALITSGPNLPTLIEKSLESPGQTSEMPNNETSKNKPLGSSQD